MATHVKNTQDFLNVVLVFHIFMGIIVYIFFLWAFFFEAFNMFVFDLVLRESL